MTVMRPIREINEKCGIQNDHEVPYRKQEAARPHRKQPSVIVFTV